MAGVNYEKKLQKFFLNNQNLISEYESIESVIPVEYCMDDIIDSYSKFINVNKNVDFNSAMKEAFTMAIKHNTNIVDAFDILKLNDIDSSLNSVQHYFKEINSVYNKHNNDYNIEYCEENREKLIEMNLKTVVSIAKKYQGLGLSLNELISAGNLGLIIAYDKFDPSRSKLKDDILNCIKELPNEFSYKELETVVSEYLKYGDIKKKFSDKFEHKNKIIEKESLIKWIHNNIYNAKFNSIATMWIRAYILIEIDNYSRVVKKPKSEIYKDRESFGAYKKEITLDIDAPVADDSNSTLGDILKIEDDTSTDLDVNEAYDIFKNGLTQLLDGVKSRDRNIFLKKFGIGLPRPMLPKEIADQEGLSIARVSQIFQTVLEQMQRNQVKYNVDPTVLFEVVKKIN